MADSYRNDLYFNIGKAGEHGNVYEMNEFDPLSWRSGYNLSNPENYTQNQKFIYPDRLIRTFNGKRDGSLADRVTPSMMKRGYIRNLSDMVVPSGARPVRCQFQFNPSRLDHSVQQNTTIRNFLLQTPSDMAQPVPGNTSFRFELFFDRTMEFNNSVTGSDFDPENAWANSSPHYVGVLHDLGILYSCIGVGQSKEGKDYALELYQQQLYNEQETTERLYEEQRSQDSDTEDSASVSLATVEPNALSDFLDVNVGNSAFLLPYPVRAVFSSLYVVEGFVGSVAVTFSKFSQSMVPLQCVVVLEMEAKYIGFAKERTFFSEMLTKQRETAREEAARVAAIQNLILGVIEDDFEQMNFAIKPAVNLGFDDSNALDADTYDVSGFGLLVEDIRNYGYDYGTDDEWKYSQQPKDKLFLTVNFPNAAATDTSGFLKKLSPIGEEHYGDAGRLWDGADRDLDGEKNFKLEEANIEVKGRLRLWAYNEAMAEHIDEHMIAPPSENNIKKQEKVISYMSSNEIVTGAEVIPVMDVDLTGAENAIATTRKEWNDMISPDDGKIWGLAHRVDSAWADFLKEEKPNPITSTDADTRSTDWYYAFVFEGSVIVKASGATVSTGASYYWASQYAASGGNQGGGQGLDNITGRIEGTLELVFPGYEPPSESPSTPIPPTESDSSVDPNYDYFPRPIVDGSDLSGVHPI